MPPLARTALQAAAPPIQHLHPAGLYDSTSNGYTHVVTAEEPLRWLFVSGQGGEDADANLPDSFAQQADQALRNVKTALAAGGASMADVTKLTVLIVDHDLQRFEQWQNSIRQHWGGSGQPPFPACTLIPVPKLALPGMLIEVDAIAAMKAISANAPMAPAPVARLPVSA